MRKARLLLLPFSVLYWVATSLRNLAYDLGALPQRRFKTPVICVGNITVGGTGKTPLTEHLVSLLSGKGRRVAVVSRGYKRKSKGQVVAEADCTAATVGDEPCQMKRKHPEADVIVDSDRAAAISTAISRGADVVIMDDGMQHRSVRPKGLILVVDYARPMWRDLPLPAGDLREDRTARLRADIVVVNKCPPGLTKSQAEAFMAHMSLNDGQQVFFSTIEYGTMRRPDGSPVSDDEAAMRGGVAVAGIGRPEPFFNEVADRLADGRMRRMAFADHHAYSPSDMADISRVLDSVGADGVIVCTEKDSMRLPAVSGRETWVLPIALRVLFGQSDELDKAVERLAAPVNRQTKNTKQ